MLKAIRCLLYGLAISSGVAGLFAGGIPLAKYAAFKWFHGPDSDLYDDPNYLFSPEVIFLLSLIVLIVAHASLVLGIPPASLPKPGSSGKSTEDSPASASEISRPAKTTGTTVQTVQTVQETADEKLAQLLNQKKD